MKTIKETILNMPAWKAGICVLLIMFGMSLLFEVILSHTIFHVFDRAIVKFEQIDKEDKEDLDDIAKREQIEYCNKYKSLQKEKALYAKQQHEKRPYPNLPDVDFDKFVINDHEIELNMAIKQHNFNLRKCQEKLNRRESMMCFIRIFCLLFLCFIASIVWADDFMAIAKEAENNRMAMAQKYLPYAEDAKNHEAQMTSLYKKEASDINLKMTPIQNSTYLKIDKNSVVIIFISFSMPEQSIVSILQDSKRIHGTVVIRGLIHNSFKETFLKMGSLVKAAGSGGGVELNPPAFKKFNIQKVPAVVVLPDNETCRLEKKMSG